MRGLGIRELVNDLRRICGDLRPPTIDSLGLGAALQSFTRDWSEHTHIEVGLISIHNSDVCRKQPNFPFFGSFRKA